MVYKVTVVEACVWALAFIHIEVRHSGKYWGWRWGGVEKGGRNHTRQELEFAGEPAWTNLGGSTRECGERLRRECVCDLWPPMCAHNTYVYFPFVPLPHQPGFVWFSKLNEPNRY